MNEIRSWVIQNRQSIFRMYMTYSLTIPGPLFVYHTYEKDQDTIYQTVAAVGSYSLGFMVGGILGPIYIPTYGVMALKKHYESDK